MSRFFKLLIAVLTMPLAAYSASKGTVFEFSDCYLHGIATNGKVMAEKTDSNYVICTGGKVSECSFFQGSLKKHTQDSKPYDIRQYVVFPNGNHIVYSDKSMSTSLIKYLNGTALTYSNSSMLEKGLLARRVCNGVVLDI